ncbi:ABC transporter substrate-binding protein [Pseudobutyrivibrio sp.]|uniref:ABC transporter substrate-binding protein n=1 Tax=Pseudobutyrivibrio sp. TaxID=2014367 RepID=UPI001B4941EA|nr:ABC transporter substrate-binding protein [Pseudobutyrivibrio sp.]MBP3263208.1 ABC transporter substrate-binding protein [Pseudobutyrivibrio sp.]
MMNKIKKIIGLGLVLSLTLGLFVGCGQASAKASENKSEAADANEQRVIRLGNFPFSIWNAQIIVAYQNGYFDEVFEGKNVDVEITDFANGPAANEAFVAGDLDIINGIGDQPIVVGIANGVDTKILSGAAKQGENIGVIAPGDRGITSTADLKGKKVGVYIGTYVHKSIIGILNDAGLSEEDVELVNISSTSDASAAFASGDIDAYLSMSGDYIHEKVDGEGYVVVNDCANHPAFSYIVASAKFVDENQDILADFYDALDKAQKFIDENTDEAYSIIAEFSDYDVDTVRYTIENADIQLAWDEDYEQNLLETYDFLFSHEMITTELSEDDILDRVDTSIIDTYSK